MQHERAVLTAIGTLKGVLAVLGVLVVFLPGSTRGHGFLSEPPNRASMWRYGFNTTICYDDNQFWCGGFAVQWEQHKGRCGPCGDSFSLHQPRPNENGGKYGRGIVARKYKMGEEVTVTVQLTANHRGYFTFSICRLNTPGQQEQEECFHKNPLQLADGSGTQFKVTTPATGAYHIKLRLPPGITCTRCVLQWHYNTGNSWGICSDGSGGMGCGPQENFRSCSDIAIE